MIHQENRGLGGARNRGLDEVATPFVCFLDSDDILPKNAIGELLATINQHDCDIAVGIMETFPKPTKHVTHEVIREKSGTACTLLQAPALVHSATACNKMFRVDFVKALKLRFGERVHFEDVYFTLPALFSARSIGFTDTVVYEYRRELNSGSIMSSLFTLERNYADHLTANEFLFNRLGGQLTLDERDILDAFCVRSIQGFALRAPEVLATKDLDEFFERAVELYKNVNEESIKRWTIDAKHRFALATIYLNDKINFLAGFKSLTVASLENSLLTLDRPAGDEVPTSVELRNLLTTDKFQAFLDGASIDLAENHLKLSGRIRIRGHKFTRPPQFTGTIKLGGVSIPLVWTVRYWAENIPGSEYLDFDGYAEINDLRVNDSFARINLVGLDGTSLSRRLVPSRGLIRRLRILDIHGTKATLITPSGYVALCQDPGIFSWEVFRGLRNEVNHRVSMIVSLVLFVLTRRALQKKNYWLIGERSDTARKKRHVLVQCPRRRRA